MKAVIFTEYGAPDVLKLTELEKPVPGDKEILIKIAATAVNSGDWRIRKADPFAVRFFFGMVKPKKNILGGVFSGVVEKTGKDVKLFKSGDSIFGMTGMSFGAYAEYMCLPENGAFALKPGNITHQEAAVIPFGATTALHFMKQANISSGQKVLIYGASGAVGTAAIQVAKYFGAKVTGVCSTANLEMVRSLGADEIIDYKKKDFTDNVETYDVIFDTINKIPISLGLKSLNKNGILISSAAGLGVIFGGLFRSMFSSKKVITGVNKETAENMIFIKGLIESGKLKAVIDKTYALEQIAEAHAYAEKGHKKGNVSIVLN